MAKATLLDLSRGYAAGRLDFASYRQQRRSLIRQQLQATEERTLPAANGGRGALDSELTGDRTRDFQPTAAVSLAKPARRRHILLAIGLAALIAAAVTVYLTAFRDGASPGGEVVAQAENPLLGQVAELLGQGEISPAQLTALVQSWQRLEPGTRRQLRGDRLHSQLLQQLNGQIQVLEALDPAGNDATVTAHIAQLTQAQQQLSTP